MNRLAPLLLYVVTLLGGTYSMFQPTFASGFTAMQTNIGDTVLNHYLLEHSWQAITRSDYAGTLLSPPFYFPQPLVLGYSETLLGVAPPYWALRLILPDDLAYQAWMILMAGLNFVAFVPVARRLGCSHVVAAFGGFLWAFALVHVSQMGHQQSLARFWCPLAVYYAHRFSLRPELRSLHRLLACVVLQTAACVYTGWFLGLGLAIHLPLLLSLRPNGWQELRSYYLAHRMRILGVVGLWGAALLLVMMPYVVANRGVVRSYRDCIPHLPDLSCWVAGPPDSRWFQTVGPHRDWVNSECALFCGLGFFVLLVLAGWKFLAARSPERDSPTRVLGAACLLTAGTLVLATLHFGDGVSGWWLLRLLPGGGAIRAVSRVYVVVYLFADVAIVLALSALLANARRVASQVLIYALMAFVGFEQTGHVTDSFAKVQFYPLAEDCARSLRGAEVGFVTGRYGDRGGYQTNLLGMWAGLRANVPVVNGYSGRAPDGYDDRDYLTEGQVRDWLTPRFTGTLRVVNATAPGQFTDVEIRREAGSR